MENNEYKYYWETNMFFQTEELDSWGIGEAFTGNSDSSSPDGAQSSSSPASKNIESERNRRRKLGDRLLALRAAVPKISKMDKASIIKDAIDYIQELHEQERIIQAEIVELESQNLNKNTIFDYDQDVPILSLPKKKRIDQSYDSSSGCSRTSPIEVLELRVSDMGDKTLVVSLTCSKRTDTMVKLCEVFESLNLKVITGNITAFSGRILKTEFVQVSIFNVRNAKRTKQTARDFTYLNGAWGRFGTSFVSQNSGNVATRGYNIKLPLKDQADEEEKDHLKIKIQRAIEALNYPESPMST